MAKNNWMERIVKDFGKVASDLKKETPQPIPSWSPSLNWATGIGGFQPGKISILYGPEQSGKSLLAMMGIIELQRRDPDAIAIWFDAEYSFSVDFFQSLGGNLDRLVVRRSNAPTQIFDYIWGEMLELLQDGAPIRAICIDSIKSICYPKDLKKQSIDQTMGGAGAPFLGPALKRVLPVISEHNILTFFVQQVSMQLDPMKAMRNPYVLPDGQALKHAGDIMLEIIKLDTKNGIVESGETIAGGAQQTGHKVRVKVKKNRLGVPARVAQFTLGYGRGIINTDEEIFELAKSIGVICHPTNPATGKENVQMWQFGSYPAIRGEDNMKKFVAGSKVIQDEIMAACYNYKDVAVEVDAQGVVVEKEEIDLNLGDL